MVGRTVVITGANTGLGYATAQRLIARGARVIVSCRSGAKCTATAKSLGGPPVAVCGPPLELQDLVSVRTFARYIEGLREPVHALVNNAGGMMPSRVGVPMIGEDGSTTEVEATFAANCVGPAALTLELLPVLARSGEHGRAARVVTVASKLEKGAQLDAFLSDVSGRSNAGLSKPGEAGAAASFDTWVAYANSKQGNIHATVALADAFRASNVPVTAVVVTPGMVNTDLGRQFSWFGLTAPLRWLLLPSSHAGAEATIYAVTSRHIEGESGVYYGKVSDAENKSWFIDKTLHYDEMLTVHVAES